VTYWPTIVDLGFAYVERPTFFTHSMATMWERKLAY
jgi:hypothetical protein